VSVILKDKEFFAIAQTDKASIFAVSNFSI
jgi:hypothetical protein